jgi:hypothetical protein
MTEKTLDELAEEVVSHIKERNYGLAESKAELLHSKLILESTFGAFKKEVKK